MTIFLNVTSSSYQADSSELVIWALISHILRGYNLIFSFFDLKVVTDNIALNAIEHKGCHVVTVKKDVEAYDDYNILSS